jgi:hypothetical protein
LCLSSKIPYLGLARKSHGHSRLLRFSFAHHQYQTHFVSLRSLGSSMKTNWPKLSVFTSHFHT